MVWWWGLYSVRGLGGGDFLGGKSKADWVQGDSWASWGAARCAPTTAEASGRALLRYNRKGDRLRRRPRQRQNGEGGRRWPGALLLGGAK